MLNGSYSPELQATHCVTRPARIFRVLYQSGFYLDYRELVFPTGTVVTFFGIPGSFNIAVFPRAFMLLNLCLQSALNEFSTISDLVLYTIGTFEYNGKVTQAWRYMSYVRYSSLYILYPLIY